MSDQLDLLLEAVREPEPEDEAFIHLVMRDVRADEQRRVGRRTLRRPLVIGLAAAAVVTGSAVAAVVGSNPSAPDRVTNAPKATTTVTASEPPVAAPDAPIRSTEPSEAPSRAVADAPKAGADALTEHSSVVTDEETGLRLLTETHTTAFTVGRSQRVTLTLSNTGRHPITVSGARGCTLQVMAAPAGEEMTLGLGGSAWSCAGSDEDPRIQAAEEKFVLAPGDKVTADANVTLRSAGEWDVVGICRCSFTQVRPTPIPRDGDLLTDLTQRSLNAPLLPETTEGRNLTTPAVRVRAK